MNSIVHQDPVSELANVMRGELAVVTEKLIFLNREINLLRNQLSQAYDSIDKLQQAMSNHSHW